MNEEWKKWLTTSAGFGAGFALMMVAIVGGGLWYISRPNPPKPPKPWNGTAIWAEFLEPATSDESATINLWYSLTNTTDADYKIDSLNEITTAGSTKEDDALWGFNQGISFEVPLIVAAHRKAKAILHLLAPTQYEPNVMAFLRSDPNVKGFVTMDERTRYEIDFPLPDASRMPAQTQSVTQSNSQTSSKRVLHDPQFRGLPRDEQRKVLQRIDPDYARLPEAKQLKVLVKVLEFVSRTDQVKRRPKTYGHYDPRGEQRERTDGDGYRGPRVAEDA